MAINFIQEDCPTIDCKLIGKETLRDKILLKIVNFLRLEWPKNAKNSSEYEKNFFKKRNELIVENDCVL